MHCKFVGIKLQHRDELAILLCTCPPVTTAPLDSIHKWIKHTLVQKNQ